MSTSGIMYLRFLTLVGIITLCASRISNDSSTTQLRFYNIIVQRNPESTVRDLMCSGVLISFDIVLTVAHCFFNSLGAIVPKENFAIILGDMYDSTRGNRLIPIKSIRIHPEYQPPERLNDVALVTLQEEIEADADDVAPIGIATYAMPPGVKCFISTWLNLLYGWSISTTIQEVPVVIVDSSNCSVEGDFLKRTICMQGNYIDLDGSYFLSGSPLICNNVLAGLSSQTIRSTLPLSAESFTNITFYWPWISNNEANSMAWMHVWMLILFYCIVNKII